MTPDRPAFPVSKNDTYGPTGGMTLREHYAGLAMQGLMSQSHKCTPEQVAKLSVMATDALIKALEESK